MKKLFSVVAILLALGTANVFAKTGVGLQGGPVITNGYTGFNGAVTFKLNNIPCTFAVTVPSFNPFAIGLTADYWIANPSIQSNWKWYYGAGVAASLYTGGTAVFGIGGRFYVGTNLFLLNKFLELYAEIAWQPMLFISNGVYGNLVNFPVNFGFRFWF